MLPRRVGLAVLAVFAVVVCTRVQPSAQVRRFVPLAESTPAPLPSEPFFDDTVLHEIRLTINSRDWQSLRDHYLDNTYYQCDFKWKDKTVRGIGIRSRGNGSRSGVKPGLRLDFDRYVTDQKFLGLKSFVLRNNTQDPSSLHERLSMLIFKRMGLPAPKEAHVKLYINNAYAGLYTIVESIDRVFLKNTFDNDGGYLYKYDYPADEKPYYFEYKGNDPRLYVPLPFKPETHESDPRPEFVEQLVRTVNETSDAQFRSAINDYLDLERFIRHVAVEIWVGDDDGFLGGWGMNNFYIYRFDAEKRFRFIAWDKSNAFLDGWWYPIWHNITDVEPERQNRLMRRVMSYSNLKALFLDTLQEISDSTSELEEGQRSGPGWFEREIERDYRQIRDAARSDPEKAFSNDEFEDGVDALREFARKRAEFVRVQILDWRSRSN